ncbi:MAG: hypothetical protein R2789_11985 [Microthrixaceae bacterium]
MVIHGRSDTTLNPGGVRIGTAEIYRQVEQIPEVLESLVFGRELDGDVQIVLLVTLRGGCPAGRATRRADQGEDPFGLHPSPRSRGDPRGGRSAAHPFREARGAWPWPTP